MGKSSKTHMLLPVAMDTSLAPPLAGAPTIEEFVEYKDAISRIEIAMVNAASWRIRQYGGLITREGFIAGDVRIAIFDDASYAHILSPVQPQYGPLDPLTWTWVQMNPLFYGMMPEGIDEQIVQISPYEMPEILTRLTGRRDYVFLSRATGLDKYDYDNIHGIMARAFVEDSDHFQVPEDCFPLPLYDHNGVFVRMNVFYNGAVFELKNFTHENLFKTYPFLFKPDLSGICFNTPAASKLPFRRALGGGRIPLFDEIVLDTRVPEVLNGESPANAILISAGHYAGLDRVLFPEHKTFLLWHPGEPRSRQEFADALNFVVAAKKLGFTVDIRQYPDNVILGTSDLARQARSFNLHFPDELQEHAGSIKHDKFEADGKGSVADANNTNNKEI